jgi:catechol 2,3-dioxygenase-like lactoylglutathione lyase family enzyme
VNEWQLTIDCRDPDVLARFWAQALGYVEAPPPAGFASWIDWYRSLGVPEDELDPAGGVDRLVDPAGAGPRIWFQAVPEAKTVKNRLHLDLFVGGGRGVDVATRRVTVRARVDELVALGARVASVTDDPDSGTFFVVLQDPEGNEFCVA